MKFLNKVKSSIYGPDFYRDLPSKSLSFSLKYFFFFIFCLSILYSIYLSFAYIPAVKSFLSVAGSEAISNFPEELTVKIENGIASTNVKEPYFVKIPEDKDSTQDIKNEEYENILVIDTKSEFNLDQFDAYKTLAILKKEVIGIKDSHGKITIRSLKEIPDVTINKTKVTEWVNTFAPIANNLVYFIPFMVVVVMFIAYAGKLVYLLFGALVVWLLLKAKKISVTYKQSYGISLHVITLPILVDVLFYMLNFPVIPFLTTLLFVIVVWLNFKKSEVSL